MAPDRPAGARRWSCTSRPCTRSPPRRPIRPPVRLYRRMSYPRTAKVADAIIINSESLRARGHALPRRRPRQAAPDPGGGRPRAVPPRRPPTRRGTTSREPVRRDAAVRALRLLAVAVQELRRAAARVRRGQGRPRRPPARRRRAAAGTSRTSPSCEALADQLGIADDVVWVGGVPLEETVHFYRARRRLRVPVLQRDLRAADPRGDGHGLPGRHLRHAARCRRPRAAARCSPTRTTRSRIADAIVKACGPEGERLRAAGPGTGRRSSPGRPPPSGRSRCTARSTRATRKGDGDEDPRHRRSRLHRLAHLRPAGRARPRRRRPRRPHGARAPGRQARTT